MTGTFQLTPTDKPKSFDFIGVGPLGFETSLHGIYEVTEDTFTLSVIQCPRNATFTRPVEFTGERGGDYFVFKRIGKWHGIAEQGAAGKRTLTPNEVIGRFFIYIAGSPSGGASWQFQQDRGVIQNGRSVGTWKIVADKLLIVFTEPAAGTAFIEFDEQRERLTGINEHRNGATFYWEGKRMK